MRFTPVYKLPALEASSTVKEVYDQSWNIATTLEQILLNTGQVPIGADLQALIRRLNTVEAVVPDRKRLLSLEGGVNGAPPAGVTLVEKVSAVDVTVQGQLASFNFASPFPNQCTMILMGPNSGTALIPVVNGGQLSRTGCTIYLPLSNGAKANVGYHAFGW